MTAHLHARLSTTPPREREIRQALLRRVSAQFANRTDTVLFQELGLCRGQVRVDIAVVNGSLHGYEIKSEHDNLRRLASQAAMYSQVLDRATLVVAKRHRDRAVALIPDWWEVLLVTRRSDGLALRKCRSGRLNPRRDPRALVELLWLQDAVDMLDARGAATGYRGKPRRLVWDRICNLYSLDDIAEAVRSHLRARRGGLGPPLPA